MRSSFSAIVLISLLAMACGKEAEESKSKRNEQVTAPIINEPVEEFLKKQEVICGADQDGVCPGWLTKIVVLDKDKAHYCTGFLMDKGTQVATSSSCLTDILRLKGQDCRKDVFFFFPKTGSRQAERAYCKKVVQASQVNTKEDPIQQRDDLAILELETPVNRGKSLYFNRFGFGSGKSYVMHGIEQSEDNAYISYVRKEICNSLWGSYINPLAVAESSPVMTLSGCKFKRGFTGAPIMLKSGNGVKGVVSQPVLPKIRSYITSTGLLTEPLEEMFHATNMACAPTLYDSDYQDPEECEKSLDSVTVDRARMQLLTKPNLFDSLKIELERKLALLPYINFRVKLNETQRDLVETEVIPHCFKPLRDWINNFSTRESKAIVDMDIPYKKFKKGMNSLAQLIPVEVSQNEQSFRFQFSARLLHRKSPVTLFMWNDDFNFRFEKFYENCSAAGL